MSHHHSSSFLRREVVEGEEVAVMGGNRERGEGRGALREHLEMKGYAVGNEREWGEMKGRAMEKYIERESREMKGCGG